METNIRSRSGRSIRSGSITNSGNKLFLLMLKQFTGKSDWSRIERLKLSTYNVRSNKSKIPKISMC